MNDTFEVIVSWVNGQKDFVYIDQRLYCLLLKVGSSFAHVGRKSAIEHKYLEKRKLGGKKTLSHSQKIFNLTIWDTGLLLSQKETVV